MRTLPILLAALLAGSCSKESTRSAETGTTADTAGHLSDDATVIAAQLATYSLETCVVSEERLGSMGDPIDYVHSGRLVRFCCNSCIATFEQEPERYLALLDTAAAGEGK